METRARFPRFHTRISAVVCSALVMTFVLFGLPGTAAAATWSTTVLDGAGGTNGRIEATIGSDVVALRFAGTTRVFYYDANRGNLRQGVRNGTTWSFGTLDGSGGTNGRIDADVGIDVAAVANTTTLWVFYYDRAHGDLRVGTLSAGTWRFRTVDGSSGTAPRVGGNVGYGLSATLFKGIPRAFYIDATRGNLRQIVLRNGSWVPGYLDGAGGTNGRFNGRVIVMTRVATLNGDLHVLYYRYWYWDVLNYGGVIRDATLHGATMSWSFMDIPASTGGYPEPRYESPWWGFSVATFGGRLHVAWGEAFTYGGDVGYVSFDGTTWTDGPRPPCTMRWMEPVASRSSCRSRASCDSSTLTISLAGMATGASSRSPRATVRAGRTTSSWIRWETSRQGSPRPRRSSSSWVAGI